MSYTPTGLAVTKFSLAVTHFERSASGEREKATDWYSITSFGKLAETCNQYLKKGSKAYVEGRLTTRKYTDRSNVERVSLDVVLTEMEILTPREQSASEDLGELDDHPF